MKTYETARELLDCLVDFHHRACRLLEGAMDMEQSEKVFMVLDYLYQHHSELQETLATYEEDCEDSGDSGAGILNTWVPYALNANDSPEAFIDSLDVDEEMSFDASEALGRALGDYVVSLVSNICAEIAAPSVAEVFANILEMERSEQRKLTRAVNSLRDM
jgi:hypothetical protein